MAFCYVDCRVIFGKTPFLYLCYGDIGPGRGLFLSGGSQVYLLASQADGNIKG